MKKERWFQTASVATALGLMTIPWSVNDFYVQQGSADAAAHETVRHFAYFQIEPLLNGHFAPFVTAVLTIALAVVVGLLFISIDSKSLHVASTVLSGAAFAASALCALPNGIQSLTVPGVTITLLLLYSLIISIQYLVGHGFAVYDDDDE